MASDENNKNNREDCPDLLQAEMSRLRSEIRELSLKLEKTNDKLTKEKNELESERENSKTLRKFIHELNKVQLLERAPPPPPPSPLNVSIQSPQTPAMHLAVSGEFVQKLVMDKSGLESQICEQKREIESLKSKLTQSTDTQQQRHTDLLLKEQQLEECKSDYLKLEGECQLGKQLFEKAKHYLSAEKEQLQQEMDWERDRNKKLNQRIGESLQNKQQLETQITELLESITEYKKRDQELTNEISSLQNTNGELNEDLKKLETESKASIEELRETKEQQQQTIESNKKQHLSVVREKDTSISKLTNQLETLRTQFGRERDEMLLKEKQLIELNATFGIMSKQNNKLSESNENLKTKQQTDEQHIRDLPDSVIEHKKRGEELTRELSEIQASASVAKGGQFYSLVAENSKVQKTNKALHKYSRKLGTESNASIEEWRETKEKQQQTIEHRSKHIWELVKEECMFILKTKELLTSQDIALYYSTCQYMKTESDLILELKIQKQELEEYKALFSKKHENTDFVISLISEKSLLKQSIEELRELEVKLTTEKAEQHEILALKGELDIANNCIIKLKQTSLAREERLKGRIEKIEKAIMELRVGIKILNKQIPTAGGAQEEKEKSLSLLQTKDEQISELTVQILDLKSFETTFHDFTPHIVPVANNTRKIPYKILIRTNVNHVKVVKLNAFPNPDEYQGKQAILSINKHYELGVIMVIFELPSKDGLKTVSLKYVGIKLNDPMGNSDGEFRTKHYFECGPNCGIFAPFEDVFIPVV